LTAASLQRVLRSETEGTEVRSGIVFTDLDGTLLDHHTYRWGPARPALSRLRHLKIPLVLCSSKTAAELRPLAKRLGLQMPMIVENGGGIWLPRDFLGRPPEGARSDDGEYVVDLGPRYLDIVAVLADLRRRFGFSFRGFADMTAEEISDICGLAPEDAQRSKQREYDEPLAIGSADPQCVAEFERRINENGMRFTRGGRFYHVTGKNDKGAAVRELLALCKNERPWIHSVGLGDSPNDLEMLQSVDLAIIVPKPNGSIDPVLATSLAGCWTAPCPGPVGWNQAISRWLDSRPGVYKAS
jgi:mannosyl-3-phosphoglycerate phosphatase